MTVSTVAVDEVNAERRITLLRRSCRYDEAVQLIDELLGPKEEKPAAQVELGRIAMPRPMRPRRRVGSPDSSRS